MIGKAVTVAPLPAAGAWGGVIGQLRKNRSVEVGGGWVVQDASTCTTESPAGSFMDDDSDDNDDGDL
jgi:hypothetical protein